MTDHEDRRRALDALAVLAGFRRRLARLPDGTVPDVLRVDPPGRGLFVGDAKHSESPERVDTYLRLRGYACWIRARQSDVGRNGRATLALCVPADQAIAGWVRVLTDLADDVGLLPGVTRRQDLSGQESLVWSTWAPAAPTIRYTVTP